MVILKIWLFGCIASRSTVAVLVLDKMYMKGFLQKNRSLINSFLLSSNFFLKVTSSQVLCDACLQLRKSFKTKSCIRETLNLLTCVDSSNDTKKSNKQKIKNNFTCHRSCIPCHLSHVTCHLSPDHRSLQLQQQWKSPQVWWPCVCNFCIQS